MQKMQGCKESQNFKNAIISKGANNAKNTSKK